MDKPRETKGLKALPKDGKHTRSNRPSWAI